MVAAASGMSRNTVIKAVGNSRLVLSRRRCCVYPRVVTARRSRSRQGCWWRWMSWCGPRRVGIRCRRCGGRTSRPIRWRNSCAVPGGLCRRSRFVGCCRRWGTRCRRRRRRRRKKVRRIPIVMASSSSERPRRLVSGEGPAGDFCLTPRRRNWSGTTTTVAWNGRFRGCGSRSSGIGRWWRSCGQDAATGRHCGDATQLGGRR